MTGLILKDCYNLKRTFGVYSVLVLGFSIFCMVTKRFLFLSLPPVLIFSSMITNTFVQDRMVNWNKLAVTTATGRRGIVKAKYALFYLILLVATLASFILGLIGAIAGGVKPIAEIKIFLFGLTIAICGGSVSIVLLYLWKEAVEKIELITVISYMVSSGLLAAAVQAMRSVFGVDLYGFFACFCLALIFPVMTYTISVRAFENRDLE